MTKILKVKTGIAPELMKGVFEFADVPYNLRNQLVSQKLCLQDMYIIH